MFGKKNDKVTEQVIEEVSDEQLSQVSGGSLLNAVNLDSVAGPVSNVTGLVTGTVSSLGVSGIQVQAAGASVSTPSIIPGTLIP